MCGANENFVNVGVGDRQCHRRGDEPDRRDREMGAWRVICALGAAGRLRRRVRIQFEFAPFVFAHEVTITLAASGCDGSSCPPAYNALMLCELCGAEEAYNEHHLIPRHCHRKNWWKKNFTREQM